MVTASLHSTGPAHMRISNSGRHSGNVLFSLRANVRSRGDSALPTRRVAFGALLLVGLLLGSAGGCTPTVKLATDEPITINLNVNIKHEILIKVERELDDLFSKESELF